MIVEAYVDSLATVLAAEAAGADRLELCGVGEGGLTPTQELLTSVMREARVPVHAMIRPRAGGFEYTAEELAAMRDGIAMAKNAGVAGVVFGVLRRDQTLDRTTMSDLVSRARPLRVACHRAFDRTPDPDAALDTLIGLGVDLVLSSGHSPTALEGAEVLARLVQRAAGRITILAGGGVRAVNVGEVVRRSGVTEVHARATEPTVFAELVRTVRQLPTER